MPISELSAMERVARVLSALKPSANADGYEPSVSAEVEDDWHLYNEQAVSILKTLREPDIVMANAGDADIWRSMVQAALDDYEGAPSEN